jgi:hypothetical protein
VPRSSQKGKTISQEIRKVISQEIRMGMMSDLSLTTEPEQETSMPFKFEQNIILN